MAESWWRRHVPILSWLPGYPRGALRADLVGGLTEAAVVVPKSMAYAAIAGLPLQAGLYTAFLPPVIYAVLGTSPPLSVSTTSTIAILTAGALAAAAPHATPEQSMQAVGLLALLVGTMLAAASILRLGFVASFISEPVLSGFKAGVGLVVIAGQLPKLLGIHIHDEGFFRSLASIAGLLPQASLPTLALGAGILALGFGLDRFAPRLPGPLLALAAGVAASALLGLHAMGVAVVGNIPSGVPTVTVPDLALAGALWPAAAGIALMSFVETMASGRAFAAKGEARPAPDQELLALGLAGAVGALFGAMPVGGSMSQTAVNRKAGSRTQLAALVVAAGALATMMFLAPVIGLMPQAALGAVVVVTTIGLLNPRDINAIRRIRLDEFGWALVTLVGVLLLGTLDGVLVAIVVSLLTLMYQANHPPVYALGRKPGTNVFRPLSPEHPGDETQPGLLVMRLEGRIYFANAQRAGDKMWALVNDAKPRVLIIDCGAVPDVEYTALRMLIDAEERLRDIGVELWLAHLNPHLLEIIRRSPLEERLASGRMFADLGRAVDAFHEGETPGDAGPTAPEIDLG